MVDIDKRQELRREDDRMCYDHEHRIRALEKSYEHVISRIDRSDVALHSIETAVTKLQDEMTNHIKLMNQHIDLAFRQHEINEMKMHKDMLVQAIKATAYGLVVLAGVIGTMGWWIFSHVTGNGG
jgi:hypothetical protein